MVEVLGILVNSDKNLDHLINVTRSARALGKEVVIFFTHRGVLLTQDPKFTELEGLTSMSLCKASLETHGLEDIAAFPGIDHRGLANQSRHADLIFDCDRYLVL